MKKIEKYNHQTVKGPDGINIKELLFKMTGKWKLFLLFGILGIAAAFIYNKLSQTKYGVSSTILVKVNDREAALTSLYKDPRLNKNPSIQNQVGVVSSYNLTHKTLQTLDWDVSWYKKSLLSKVDLYKDEPFKVESTKESQQIKMIPIHITPISESKYMIEADAEQKIGDIKREISFAAEGTFGKPFKNKYFNFTLHKIENKHIETDKEYILYFNDLGLLAKDYQKNLKISTADDEANLMYLKLETKQPERAIDYLNTLGKVYIEFGLNEKNRLANSTVKFIDNQLAGITDSLKNAGNDFTNFRSDNRVVNIGQESSLAVENLGTIENNLSAVQMRYDYYNSIRRYLNNANALKNLSAPSVVGVTDPSLNALLVKLSDLFGQREVLSYTVQDQNPQLIALDNEIKYTQRSLAENINNLLNNTRVELRNLNQQRARVNGQLTNLPKTEQNLTNIKRDFDLNNELYTFLLQKRSEAEIERASRQPDAQILDPATLGTVNQLGFNKNINLIIGFILGLLIPLLYITGKTFFDNTLMNIPDVSNDLELSIAGNIGHNKFNSELPVIDYPHSEITESFRGLRTNIQYLLKDTKNKVIAIHSSIAGEGKTFVSVNLAASIATNNKRVLLVDADLRKPRIHDILGCKNDIGLTSFLNGESSIDESIVPTKVKGLSFTGSGPKASYPSELLNNGFLEIFINQAKDRFDYIIFNNAPVYIVNDAMTVVPFSDMNLFLLRMKSSTKNQLAYINQIAQEGIIKNMAVALNNVTHENYGVFEQKGHGYYNEDRLLLNT